MKPLICALMTTFSISALAVQTNTSGVYWVPVDKQLSQYSLFDLDSVRVNESPEKIEIEYELPVELTGATNKVKFVGQVPESGAMILKSPYGTMECPTPKNFESCAVSYGGLTFNEQARTELLQAISKDNTELQKRQLVAMRFQHGGEPHGFIRVKRSSSRYP